MRRATIISVITALGAITACTTSTHYEYSTHSGSTACPSYRSTDIVASFDSRLHHVTMRAGESVRVRFPNDPEYRWTRPTLRDSIVSLTSFVRCADGGVLMSVLGNRPGETSVRVAATPRTP